MAVMRDYKGYETDYSSDVFEFRTDSWFDYHASYTEWQIDSSDQRVLRKYGEAEGTFKIPPSKVFEKRQKRMRRKNKDKVKLKHNRIPEC